MRPDHVTRLAECARLAHRLAPERCWRDAATGETCAWYHGFWPFMRLLDYGSSPELHAAFYREALAPLADSATPARLLVSGAADFAMLEVTRQAFAGAACPPQITVTDRCDTPLALCRWFAEREGFPIETKAADILALRDRAGFDAIVTHSFLGNFPPEARPRLMRSWFTLLRPGGRLVTINRLRGAGAPASSAFSSAEADAFIARMTADLGRFREHLDCPEAELAAMARTYLGEKRSFPVRTREELADLFEAAGFQLDVFEQLESSDPGKPRPSGPTMPGGAKYMKVVARRQS